MIKYMICASVVGGLVGYAIAPHWVAAVVGGVVGVVVVFVKIGKGMSK